MSTFMYQNGHRYRKSDGQKNINKHSDCTLNIIEYHIRAKNLT